MTPTSSDLAVSSRLALPSPRGQVSHSDGGVAPQGFLSAPPSAPYANTSVSSLKALGRVALAVAESSASPAHMSGQRSPQPPH